ncbi:MAG TPA: glycosyltransferase family 4 protein [Acetobacteraceae bacterium]|jgi:glycosyltransferase involved in cell wall biosynthesis
MPLTVLLISLPHPELVRGGAQQVCYELFQELRQRDDVRPYLLTAVDDGDATLFKSGAHITGFDGRDNEFVFLTRDYDRWWHKVGDPLLVESFVQFLKTIQPDVVHFHHFIGFGIDFVSVVRRVLPACRIVFTFHEFWSICAADGHMVRRTDRSLCDHASQVRCHQCFPEHAPEDFLLRKLWFSRHLAHVDVYTCPSRFMIEHYVRWGLPREKIALVPNGQRSYVTRPLRPPGAGPRNRFAFFGQLSDVKGVHIILRAVQILRASGFSDFRVEINGDHLHFATPPIRAEIDAFISTESRLPPTERLVVRNGAYDVDQLQSRMARIDWCIVPSVWWEIFGLVISEAWMFGKPVICSNVGGMAERVTDNVDGLHFEMGDPQSLADTMRQACTEEGLWQRLHDALPQPPTRADMADGYLRLYQPEAAPAQAGATAAPARRTVPLRAQ